MPLSNMETEGNIKTDPILVILIFATIIIASVLVFNQIIKSQGEDKIPLGEQGKENLNEYIVTATNQKVEIPAIKNTPTKDSAPIQAPKAAPVVKKNQSPTMIINKETKYQAVLNTSEGKIVIDLDTTNTPITSNNFITLAKNKFYNSTIFHRVINSFMIQGGDPLGNGTGGPGYSFDDEPVVGDYTRGTVAMANAGPNTNGSQFFIMHQDKDLPKNYVIFGKVSEGMDVVDKIAEAPITVSETGENSNNRNFHYYRVN
jgi:cyclophilin family peptidyl-prolyl cis-trans isomerase